MTMRAVLIGLALTPLFGWSQRDHVDAGDSYYRQRLYKEAIAEYKVALEEDVVVNKYHMTQQIAKTYFRLFDYKSFL